MKKISLGMLALSALALMGCTKHIAPNNAGPFGSSCQATNDCASGLVCVRNTCINQNLPLDPTAKVCQYTDCSTDTDCTGGDTCVDGVCTFVCTSDADCPVGQGCEASTGSCFPYDCAADADCPSFGSRLRICDLAVGDNAAQGTCRYGCASDLDCTAFEACNTTTRLCENVGCSSDRECALYYGGSFSDAFMTCNTTTGQCEYACTSDADCYALTGGGGTQVFCMDGICTDLGCDTDADCRAEYGRNYVCVDITTP